MTWVFVWEYHFNERIFYNLHNWIQSLPHIILALITVNWTHIYLKVRLKTIRIIPAQQNTTSLCNYDPSPLDQFSPACSFNYNCKDKEDWLVICMSQLTETKISGLFSTIVKNYWLYFMKIEWLTHIYLKFTIRSTIRLHFLAQLKINNWGYCQSLYM